ncbi:hypothetical protein [Gracilibacillus dipsosauri]|uniref:hypothetical protein n=1 Tax=Gracilibacillus dipsosauri TaxID=178340 RepID=UPI002409ADE6
MRPQLTDQEYRVLKGLFSDYRTYTRGLPRLLLIGLYVALAGIGVIWITLLIVAGEFNLAANLIIAVIILLLYLLFAFFMWAIISRNASKLENRLSELKMSVSEFEQIVKRDLTRKLDL